MARTSKRARLEQPLTLAMDLLEQTATGAERIRGRDEIGRHAGLRSQWGNPCRFKSDRPHHRPSGLKAAQICPVGPLLGRQTWNPVLPLGDIGSQPMVARSAVVAILVAALLP